MVPLTPRSLTTYLHAPCHCLPRVLGSLLSPFRQGQVATKDYCLYCLPLTGSLSSLLGWRALQLLMTFDSSPYSCCCLSVPGKSISQTRGSLTITTTRVRSPGGPGPRIWMTWKVRRPGGRGGRLGKTTEVLCYLVTALFSAYSPSQARVCRVSDHCVSFLLWSTLGREQTHCYPSSVGRGVFSLWGHLLFRPRLEKLAYPCLPVPALVHHHSLACLQKTADPATTDTTATTTSATA